MKKAVDPQPLRETILKQIFFDLNQVESWAKSENYKLALEYTARADALITLLEVHDCGSRGGYDPEDPKCGEHGFITCLSNLTSRAKWLKKKYSLQKNQV